MSNSVRDLQSTREKMQRYLANMEFNLYAAEQLCTKQRPAGQCRADDYCDAKISDGDNKWCKLYELRAVIGDRVVQHDPKPIGICEHGEPVTVGEGETYIMCHSSEECNYQAGTDTTETLCTREAAALAMAEQEQKK